MRTQPDGFDGGLAPASGEARCLERATDEAAARSDGVKGMRNKTGINILAGLMIAAMLAAILFGIVLPLAGQG